MAYVGLSEIARVLNISERRVQQLAAKGVIPREAKGKYDLAECAARYIRFLHESGAGNKDVAAQRARLYEAQARKVERENRVAEGELAPIAEHKRRMSSMFVVVRQRLLQLPGRIAPALEGEPRAVIKAKLTAEVYNMLTALSKPPEYVVPLTCDVCGQPFPLPPHASDSGAVADAS